MEYPFKDLLPLDEVLEREDYYRDWTHLDPKVFYSIKQISEMIKTKGFGTDVRLLIAQLAEHFGLSVAEITSTANFLISNQNRLEGRQVNFESGVNSAVNKMEADKNSVIANATVDSEVILARGGKPTLQARLDDTAAQLAQTIADDAISPERFDGDDSEKIQQAIDYTLSIGGGAIKLARMYDITDLPTLKLNKIDARDRRVVQFIGQGGGIRKDNSGFFFDSDMANGGDWFFTNVRFESIPGAGTTVFNGGKIIRIHFTNCHLRDVDHYGTAENHYFQTVNINGGTVTGGNGWLFESPCYYDVNITGGFFAEHREHFLRQQAETTGTWKSINGLRIIGCMVEGLSGKTFEFVRVEQLTIQGNYFESNKQGYIDFTQADYLDAIDISDNRVYHHPNSNPNNLASFIQWGGRLRGVSTRNNFSRYLAMHDTTEVIISSNYIVFSSQDVAIDGARDNIANIDPSSQVVSTDITKIYQQTDEYGQFSKSLDSLGVTDLNSIFIPSGKYHINAVNYENSPDSQWGFLEHNNYSSSYKEQIFRQRGSGWGNTFYRTKNGPSDDDWDGWKLITSANT